MKDEEFGLEEIAEKTSRRECLVCEKNLDEDIGEGKWHVPLCRVHRLKVLKELLK